MTSRTDFGGNTVSYTYDHMGRVVTVTDAVGDIDYGFNSLGQLVTVTDDIGKETHYSYDSAGRKESVGAGTSGTVDVTTYRVDSTVKRNDGLL